MNQRKQHHQIHLRVYQETEPELYQWYKNLSSLANKSRQVKAVFARWLASAARGATVDHRPEGLTPRHRRGRHCGVAGRALARNPRRGLRRVSYGAHRPSEND